MRFLPPEWLEAPGVTDPALARTWCRFEVSAQDGRKITLCEDLRAEAGRSGVYGSLLPLAEWALHHWFDILEERRDPVGGIRADREWRRRHAWRSGREGMSFPDLVTFRADEGVVFAWFADDEPSAAGLRFASTGRTAVSVEAAETALRELLDEIASRLPSAQDPRAQSFRRARAALNSMSRSQRRRAGFVARLGLGGVEINEAQNALLGKLEALEFDPVTEELVDAVEIGNWDPAARWATEVWRSCAESAARAGDLTDLRARLGNEGTVDSFRPWRTGWARAASLRRAVRELEASPTEGVQGRFGTQLGEWMRSGWVRLVEPVEPGAPELDGAVAWQAGRAPVIAFARRTSESARAFRTARELYGVLYEGAPDQPYARLASATRGGRLSTANAFAAELLAPVESIRHRLGRRKSVSGDEIRTLASELGVGPDVVFHQVQNHGLAAIEMAS